MPIIGLQWELVAEGLSRTPADTNQEARIEALYGVLRDRDVDVDKLRERLVSGDRIDTPALLVHPRPVTQDFDISEVTPPSRQDAGL